MFGKKILSIVGLLFFGSQISSVNAECKITLADTQTTCSMTEACSSNGYYAVTGTADMEYVANNEISNGKLVLLYGETVGEHCRLVSDNGYFKSGQENKYISNSSVGANLLTADTTCAAGVVKSNDHYKLCLDESNMITWNDGKYYLITSTGTPFSDEGTTENRVVVVSKDDAITNFNLEGDSYLVTSEIAAVSAAGNEIAVKISESEIVLDDGITGGQTIYCINGETSVIEDRKENFCSSAVPCTQYCTFTSGVCTKLSTDAQFKVERTVECNPVGNEEEKAECQGYYIKYNDILITKDTTLADIADESKISLIECDGEGNCNSISSGSFPVGFIRNADPKSNGDDSGVVQFVKCTSSSACSKLANTDNKDNCNTSGVLVTSNSFCLKVEGAKTASLASDGQYLLNTDTTSIFNTEISADHFVIVDVKYGSVLQHRKGDAVVGSYNYKYADGDLKIHERQDGEVCDTGNTINEYVFDKQTETVKDYTDNEYYTANGESKTWE